MHVLKWIRKKLLSKSAALVAAGFVSAVVFFAVFNSASVSTSKPEFCIKCHEMEFAYETWKTSSHHTNRGGVVVECVDCHLPSHKDTFSHFAAKGYVGTRDAVKHVFTDYDREANREHVYANLKNERCLRCHANILDMPYSRGARLAHMAVLYPKPGSRKKRCTDCHRRLVHKKRELYYVNRSR
ncbi:MAG: cytochrome c3 family protein [Planctomycetota bacterium]|jgi:cytochrome c nitrite reductase small subunit